jgi:hypothetical protein
MPEVKSFTFYVYDEPKDPAERMIESSDQA